MQPTCAQAMLRSACLDAPAGPATSAASRTAGRAGCRGRPGAPAAASLPALPAESSCRWLATGRAGLGCGPRRGLRLRALSGAAGSIQCRIEPESDASEVDVFSGATGRKAHLEAAQSGSIALTEGRRSLREYMALPASQYSVLDAETVQRVGDSTFICTIATLSLFGVTVQPVLTAQVDVDPAGGGCRIRVIDARIAGSPAVEAASANVRIASANDVTWGELPDGRKEIRSSTRSSVDLVLPRWFPWGPGAVERTGNFVLNQVHAQVVPRFLKQLCKDYAVWAEGDDSRSAVAAGELFAADGAAQP